MNSINWDDFKCRCSAISKILSKPKDANVLTETGAQRLAELESREKPMTPKMVLEYGKLCNQRENIGKVFLSDTCIDYLMEHYSWVTEKMVSVSKESLDMIQTRKGTLAEAQSVVLLSFIDDVEYKVHKDRINNDFLSGQTDIYLGEHIYAATNVTDMKNAWDYPVFLRKIRGGLTNGQKEQIQGYGDITGAQDLWVANTLVDTPDSIIEDMMWKVLKKIGAATFESPEFLEEWPMWYRSMKFEHISPYKRVHKIKVDPFTDEERQKVYDRVKYCRDWLWEFDEWFSKMNIPIEIEETKENNVP